MESNSNQETNSDNEEEIEPHTAEINKKKRIPPIIIDESVNTPALMDEICTLLGFKIMARMHVLKVFNFGLPTNLDTIMESYYSDEEMNSTEKEVSDVLLRISEFNVSTRGKKSKTEVNLDLQTPVELTNQFSALEVEEINENLEIEEFPEIQIEKVISSSNENLEEIDESTSVEKKQKRVPPITIVESLNTPALLDEISAIVGAKIQARMTNGKLKVFPESIDAHRKIQNLSLLKN
ncbi:hypothetical protein NPIL_446081 [Nephila pilipes]|uniref:Uncharacterized protein n=1 Tax=Nephila pilipes TaxID=299642 RepID=A0A8X6TBL7_NEPPI|nr:hypothetical protein NPIL_446081 [Nephila pilipes]